jgi:5,10-methylenetetrahydrofolate reductase
MQMQLKNKLDAGEFVILAELEPPKGVDVSIMVNNATRVKEKVDAFIVPDMTDAVLRMSALGGATALQGKGMETVMEISCRDRNRLALQADLLAAYACGITAVMIVKAEDPSLGDHHQAKAVHDLEILELLEATQNLQQGHDMAGMALSGTPQFLIGSTVNAGAKGETLDLELEEMSRKIEKGARFFISPPLFDLASIDPFLKRVDRRNTKVIPTVLLLKSVGMARYIDRHQEGIHVPEGLIERIQKAPNKVWECIQIAAETVLVLKDEGFSGVLLSTLGWEDRLPEVLERTAG